MPFHRKLVLAIALLGLAVLTLASPAGAGQTPRPTDGKLLASGLEGTIGGTIGPDGALYVPEGALGRITRIDPRNGKATTFASGLPPAPFGGVIDVAFIGTRAYALVTLVAPDHVVGIYRVDDADSFTVIADLGAFSIDNPPPYPIDVPTGLQYALQPVAGGFLITDGHHNRVLRATLSGQVTELIALGNDVPTGLAVSGKTVYMAEAGPIPHTPETGKVVAFDIRAPILRDVASGFSLIVDVELGRDGMLYALSQGDSPGDVPPASPAKPDSGKLLRVNHDGTFTVLVDRLDLPTSLDFAGDTAFIVTLNGEVWRIKHVSKAKPVGPCQPFRV